LYPDFNLIEMAFSKLKVMSRRLSITINMDLCLEAGEEAISCYGKPEIFQYGPRLAVQRY
jgi:hypothetical protein